MASLPATPEPSADHGALMDSTYRWQRHIYDITRKYFLFGRDRLIAGLDMPAGGTLLEIGCGTGRNLAHAHAHWPQAMLHGLDISPEMLKTAALRLDGIATLAVGDACHFDPQALFGIARFDRVMISFALSMIPDWEAALEQASALLAPGGTLHIVDFGDGAGLPRPFRAALRAWLARFHVTPRLELITRAGALVRQRRFRITTRRGAGGYYQLITLTRRAEG